MNRLSKLWSRIERKVIYSVLGAFIFLQLLALFIPVISSLLSSGGALILIGAVLVAFFRFIDERLPEKVSDKAIDHFLFRDVADKILKELPVQHNTDIFAHTGVMYYRYFHDSNVRIRRLRILICNPEVVSTLPSPLCDNDKIKLRQVIENTVECWYRFKREGGIESIEIRTYNFMPTFHFMISDGQISHFGVLLLRSEWTGLRVLESYLIKKEISPGNQLIADFSEFYEMVFTQFSNPWPETLVPK